MPKFLMTNIKFKSTKPLDISSETKGNKKIWTITETLPDPVTPDKYEYHDFSICSRCGSDDVQKRGYIYPNSGLYEWSDGADAEFCLDCGDNTNLVIVQMPNVENVIWTVESVSLCDGWKNTWSEIEAASDRQTPRTFATSQEAMEALNEYLNEMKAEYCTVHGWNACPDNKRCTYAFTDEDYDTERNDNFRLQPIPADNPFFNFYEELFPVSEDKPIAVFPLSQSQSTGGKDNA